jgi:hypothetical protein
MVKVRATLEDEKDGVVTLSVPCREVTPEEAKVLDRLFPRLNSAVELLLAQEALLDCVQP